MERWSLVENWPFGIGNFPLSIRPFQVEAVAGARVGVAAHAADEIEFARVGPAIVGASLNIRHVTEGTLTVNLAAGAVTDAIWNAAQK